MREFIFPRDCDSLEESINKFIPEEREVINTILNGNGLMNPFQNEFSRFDTDMGEAVQRLGSIGAVLQGSNPQLSQSVLNLFDQLQGLQSNMANYKAHVDRLSGVGSGNLMEFGKRFGIAKAYSTAKQQMGGPLGEGFTGIYGSLENGAGEMFSKVTAHLTSITEDIFPEGTIPSNTADTFSKLAEVSGGINEQFGNITNFINQDESAFAEALNYVTNYGSALSVMNAMKDEDDCFTNHLLNDMVGTDSLKSSVNSMKNALGEASGQGISDIIGQLTGANTVEDVVEDLL